MSTDRSPVLNQPVFEVYHPKISPALDGLRLVQFSDLHLRHRETALERKALAVLADSAPDVLLFTGDAVNRAHLWDRARTWLEQLPPVACRFAVPGNWDYHRDGSGRARFDEVFTEAGFQVLINRSGIYTGAGAPLHVAGVDDVRRGQPDPVQAVHDVSADAWKILLSHNPDILLDPGLRCDLLLCGHTHGGQFRPPGIGPVYTSTRTGRAFAAGWREHKSAGRVYINRGIGTGDIPWRWRCPPEITLFILRSEPAPTES